MLPAAVAIAMVGFISAFGSGIPSAFAIPGDSCYAQVLDSNGVMDTYLDNDVEGNPVYRIEKGNTYGLLFWVEDAGADLYYVDAYPDAVVGAYLWIDSEGGSGAFTSQMEITDYSGPFDENDDVNSFPNYVDPDLSHLNYGPATSIYTDVVETYDFNDANGDPLDSIADWVADATNLGTDGVSSGVSNCDNGNYTSSANDFKACDGGYQTAPDSWDDCNEVDGWGFVDFECTEFGTFYIVIDPEGLAYTNLNPSEDGWPENAWDYSALSSLSIKFVCGGVADSATISASPTTVETDPVGTSKDTSKITVTVEDQDGLRLDGALVTFTTDNCTFKGIDGYISPAAGGTTVETTSDTEGTSDDNFVTDNPLQSYAGTAEVNLDCSKGSAGVAHVKAVVERPGSDIVLDTEVTVVGPASATGLTLTLTPDDLECGETILATANAVDSLGAAVSNGTKIHFTTDTSSGIVGGSEGAQGGVATAGGEASVLIATDPSNPGVHTVIAYTTKGVDGDIIAQTSATYTCDAAVAPAAPTVAPPATGTGTGSITPPNTGDAGLAAGSTSNASLFVIVGAVAFVLAGLASVRFARN
jgi:hypothetical protein